MYNYVTRQWHGHASLPPGIAEPCKVEKSEDVVGRRNAGNLRVANIEGLHSKDQPYTPALQTWHYRFLQTVVSSACFHLNAISM